MTRLFAALCHQVAVAFNLRYHAYLGHDIKTEITDPDAALAA
jgi:hypothetical protein